MQAIDILKKYWGHNSFRLKQEEVINSIINKKDTLALLPTGGGKSICYQIPAILREGICIVVSPLLSLIEDQTKHLKSKGIKSISISSMMSKHQIDTALTNCIYGGFKFLYLSPEKLRDTIIRDKIKEMNVNLIAIDEAHCISEWGHNFRPSYRLIDKLREIKKDVPVLALTATANQNVINDIQENLNFKEKNLIKSSFFRKNLSYVVVRCNDKEKTLLKLLNKIKSSVIIYVNSRKESNQICSLLNKHSISASSYHAGIDIIKRKKKQEEWFNNSVRVIVATNAFGLGINKTDVRLIVHMHIPMNIESYFQESGRAGRDGKTAYSFILYNKNDINENYKKIQERFPKIKQIQNIYQKICDFLQIPVHALPDEDFGFNIKEFCARYKLDIRETYNIINYLENEELIKLHDTENRSSKVKILMSNSELYKYQIANSHYDNIIKSLLRGHSNIFGNYVNINEESLAKKTQTDNQSIRRILVKLEENGVISYRKNKNGLQLRFIQERRDAKKLNIPEKKIILERKNAQKKLEKTIKYIQEDQICRNKMLLDYFNEDRNERCNVCDYCIKKNKNKIQQEKHKEVSLRIIKILEEKECDFDQISSLIKEIDNEEIKDILKYLFDNDIIHKFGNKYIINKK